MATLAEQIQGERMARVALSMIAEPNDPATGHVLAHVGAVETLRLIESDDPVPGLARADALMWRAQLAARIAPGLVRRVAETQGGEFRILIPVDNEWPAGLDDLGDRAPYLLWTRGAVSFLSTALSDRVTFTGSRASTSYGEHVTSELAAGLADEERIVVSGGAYGIETAAQRSALAAGGQTIGVLPNGLDLPYPSRRSDLLEQIGDVGLLLSELPPGTPPSKDRFTARNRLMAALAGATVIPEAGVRSGSITTILAARSLGRGVGAVPGPITKRRVTRSEFVRDEAAAHAFFDQLRISSTKGVDVSMTLLEFVTSIGDRWARGLDPTSTVDTYAGGLKLRVLPALGHLPIAQITAGMIDRTIDEWEKRHGASTIKNTIAPMVRVLDEAVRDGLLTVKPGQEPCQAESEPQRLPRAAGRRRFAARPRDQRPGDTDEARRCVRAGAPVLLGLRDARRALGRSQLGGVWAASEGRAVRQEPCRDPPADIPRQGRAHHQAHQEPQGASSADPGPTASRARTSHRRQAAGGSTADRAERRRADHRDRSGCDELGSARDRPRASQPDSTRPPAHGRDVARRCGRAAACASRNPRARLDRDDARLPASRRPAPGVPRIAPGLGAESARNSALVPFWSPYPQVGLSAGQQHLEVGRFASAGGPEGDHPRKRESPGEICRLTRAFASG